MKKILPFFLFLISLQGILLIPALSQQAADLPAPVKGASVEGITEYKLANGLRVLIFPDPSKPTITVNITYLVGSRVEGYGETGMAHLLEHMLFKGSTNHTNIPQELSSHGAQPNGSTSYDRTNYFETFSATDENLNWALSLESDRMVNSFIKNEDLQSEFSVVRNEFEMGENSPDEVLEERVMSTAYLWHNYGKSTIGSKEDIEKVPIENLQAFYREYYQPDNAVLTIAGKVDEAKTIALANKYFGPIPKPTRELPKEYTTEPAQDGERYVELKRVGDVQVVSCGYHVSAGSYSDFGAVSVLIDVLTNVPSGRLYKALVETKKASSIYGYAYSLKDPGFAYFAAEVLKDRSLDSAKQIFLGVFDDLKKNPVTDDEVNRAKTKLLKNFELTYNNSAAVGLTLSEYIAQGDWRLWFLSRDRLEKVTAADVNAVVNDYFKTSNRTVGVFIPDASPDRAMIPAAPNVKALVKDYKGKEALKQAEAFDASCANIDARTKTGKIAGGAQYAFLKKETRGSSVNVVMTLRIGNEQAMQNKGAVSQFTAGMLRRGTKTKTYQQINDGFDKLKANVNISGSGQTVRVSISTVKDSLVKALKLVTEVLRQPVFPQEEFAKMVDEQLADIEQQRSEPQSIAFNEFNRILNPFPKTDFRYAGTFDEQAEEIRNVKLDDVKKFYTDFYQSTNATVAVVGDFDETAVTNELTNMLKNWNSKIKYARAVKPFFDVPAADEKINTPDKANATLAAGYNLKLRDDDPDYPALIMGNYMLGGGFLNSRLATRIRQKEGISYGVGSFLNADPIDQSGTFGSYAIYNPENSGRLITAYKEELDSMLKKGFSDSELKDAISGYLQDQNVNRARDSYLSNTLSSNLFLKRTMKWNEMQESKIATLTADQVNAAMRKWIQPEKITYIQAGDFGKSSK